MNQEQHNDPMQDRNDLNNDQNKEGFFAKCFRLLNTEAMRYLIIGGCTTLVNLVVFTILCEMVHMNVNLANIISIIISILFAYVTNKQIVFRSHCSSFAELMAEFTKFVGARLATMAIEVGGVFLIYNVMHQNEIIAKLATQVIVILGNYFISKFLVFTTGNKDKTEVQK